MASGHRSILIAGAGATGLAAALELARRGFLPRIVDSDAGPVPLTESRALGINARTLTLLSPSRVTDTILQEAQRIAHFRIVSGGRLLADIDTTRVPGPYSAIHALAQGIPSGCCWASFPTMRLLRSGKPRWRQSPGICRSRE